MEEENNIDRNWFKKHSETIAVIIALLSGFLWIDSKMDSKFDKVDSRLSVLEKDVAVIKSVLVMKNILPSELCAHGKDKEESHTSIEM